MPTLTRGRAIVCWSLIQHQKQPGLGTAADDDRVARGDRVGTLNVGYISLTIQRKSDLKALSSEKISALITLM